MSGPDQPQAPSTRPDPLLDDLLVHFSDRLQAGAAAALEKATQLPNRDVSYARFLLAMAFWRLGEKDRARRWYDLAAAQVDLHEVRQAEILRFRAEAKQVLGIRGPKH